MWDISKPLWRVSIVVFTEDYGLSSCSACTAAAARAAAAAATAAAPAGGAAALFCRRLLQLHNALRQQRLAAADWGTVCPKHILSAQEISLLFKRG